MRAPRGYRILRFLAVPGRRSIILLVVLAAVGCREDSEPTDPAAVSEADATSEVDRIRSLGYAGYASEKAKPEESGVNIVASDADAPGYFLYGNRDDCSAFLVNRQGEELHSWRVPDGRHWARWELLPDGSLVVVGSDWKERDVPILADDKRYVLRLDWDNEVIWKKVIPAHHDVDVTPDGDLLALTLKHRRVPEVDPEVDLRDHLITRLSMDGDVLEEYSLYDIMSSRPDLFTFRPVKPDEKRGHLRIDLFHANSVEAMRFPQLESRNALYHRDNILVSIRHQDTIAFVDVKERTLVWAWGQGEISGPHDATLLENGNVLLFDNGIGRRWSRVIELDPLTREIVWEYQAPRREDFYSEILGSNQRLPNGNTLIAQSTQGKAFEVTPAGEIVWTFHNPLIGVHGQRAIIVRIKRYDPAYVEPLLVNAGPGPPAE